MRDSAVKNKQPIPFSVLLSSTGTPKRRQCKGLLCGPQIPYRLWTQWRNIPLCAMACDSSPLRLLGARGSQMIMVRAIKPCKAALSQKVQLHQMPLAWEPKHFSLIFHLLLKHRGVSDGCTTEEDNKPAFCLTTNCVRLFPHVLTYKEASMWLRLRHSYKVTKGPG